MGDAERGTSTEEVETGRARRPRVRRFSDGDVEVGDAERGRLD